MALGKTRKRSKNFIPPKLQITSMMDMFTIILIFLLVSFSDHPETVKIGEDLQLPSSTAKLDYNENITLVLSQKNLKLGDRVIGRLRNGKIIGLDTDNPEKSLLYKQLRARWEKEKSIKTDVASKKTSILFLCDKRLTFKTINSIIKTAGMAGYPNFQFGVLSE